MGDESQEFERISHFLYRKFGAFYNVIVYCDHFKSKIQILPIMDAVIGIIRSQFSSLRMPGPHDKVFNDECVLTFDR
jgi:hypothetical protein